MSFSQLSSEQIVAEMITKKDWAASLDTSSESHTQKYWTENSTVLFLKNNQFNRFAF